MKFTNCLSHFLLIGAFVVLIQSCGGYEDEPKLMVDFSVSCNLEDWSGASTPFIPEKNGGTLTAIGWEYGYTFDITGVYDYFMLVEGCPDWISLSTTPTQIKIKVSDHFSETPRKVTIRFAVFKGDVSSSGFINIMQEPVTEAELKEHEEVYMLEAIAGKTVLTTVPADGNFISGTDAPYYKLSDDVYMQVVYKGTASTAKSSDRVYFRFIRYRLIDWINGNLTNGEGNMNSLTGTATSFVIGSTNQSSTQWGTAIPRPMLLGLPYGSVVNLIVRSPAGFEAEKSYYQPYFYNIRYFKSEI